MQTATIENRNVAGTEATVGWAGGHTLIIDRPSGRAGGLGLGRNGAQLMGLTIGGCFANDLRHVAHQEGVKIENISITVDVNLQGDPIIATDAVMRVSVEMADGSDGTELIRRTSSISMAMNSLNRGIAVRLQGYINCHFYSGNRTLRTNALLAHPARERPLHYLTSPAQRQNSH
jgi:organic hydroperoxide reductase OsmC/OhrA